jgi:glucose/arabinose dehydrogenase
VVSGLEAPWGLDFLPDGTAVVTERDSRRVLVIEDGKAREIGTVTQASPGEEAGLLGIAVSPDFEQDKTLFLYLTTQEDNRIVRTTYDGKRLGELDPIVTGIPRGLIHDGGRLAFGPDGLLIASTGDSGDQGTAQDEDSLGGKILRMTPEGKAAPGNPNNDLVLSLGHRNVQGLAFDSTGQLWASEFGSQEFDELNRIEAGRNYGWPQFEGEGGTEQMTDPQVVWSTDEASPSGLAYAEGHLWMASLRGERLWRVDVADGNASAPKDFFVGDYGRLRTVALAPNGKLWLTTSNRDGRGDPAEGDDRILEVTLK